MSSSFALALSRQGARIGRWPRRIACVLCLLLAALSAVQSGKAQGQSAAADAAPASSALRAGEVAISLPVSVADAGLASAGQHIGVLSTPDEYATRAAAVLVADHLRVLSVGSADALGGDDTVSVVVAARREIAVLLAKYVARPLFLIADDLP